MFGELRRTVRANARTSDPVCTVLVGLFGLQRKISPAPRAAASMASRSSFPSALLTGIDTTVAPMYRATRLGWR